MIKSNVVKIRLEKLKLFCILGMILITSCSKQKDAIPEQTSNFCKSIHRNDSISLSDELKGLDELMRTKTGVYVLEDGAGSMVSRAWLTDYAEETIDIQYFIFSKFIILSYS